MNLVVLAAEAVRHGGSGAASALAGPGQVLPALAVSIVVRRALLDALLILLVVHALLTDVLVGTETVSAVAHGLARPADGLASEGLQLPVALEYHPLEKLTVRASLVLLQALHHLSRYLL